MFNINLIKVPFVTAVSTSNITDSYSFYYTISGSYGLLPYAEDAFDIYNTGGGAGIQLYFSGSGNWLGSGYTLNDNLYFYDTFNAYQTGVFPSGLPLSSGYTIIDYGSFVNNYSGYTLDESLFFYDTFDIYRTGTISGYGATGNNLFGLLPIGSGLDSGYIRSGYVNTLINQRGYTIWSGYF
jgi:hypothetical protein